MAYTEERKENEINKIKDDNRFGNTGWKRLSDSTIVA